MKRGSPLLVLALLLAVPASGQYFGKNKVRYDSFDWKVYPTPHFRISFYDRSEPSLARVASFAESAYDTLARRLNFQIQDPIPLLAYATHAEFEQTNVIEEFIPEGVGAFAVPARDRMVLPVDMPDAELYKIISHELTHIFQYEILFQGKLGKAITSSPPQWFMEGMASYMGQDEDSKAQAVMRDAALSDRVPSVASDVSGYFAYRFGNKVFAFVESEWGLDGLRDFIFEFRNSLGGRVAKPIKRAFDLDVEEFDARFRSWLRKYYEQAAIERGDPREFGPVFRVQEESGSVETSPVASPSGDLIAAFTTYKHDADVVLLGVPKRTLYRNLTRGNTTAYQYLVAQALTVGPDRGRDLAYSPDGNRVAVFAREERGRVLLLLDALHGGVATEYPIPVDQAMSPAYSPDGSTIAFHAFTGGRADIYLLDLGSGQVRNFTEDAAFDSAPTFTPDGTALVFSSQSGEDAKLFEVPLSDPKARRQLTFGPGNDEGAAFSSDGKRLYFASDRDGGVFDIYGLDLKTHALVRLTRVIGSALSPAPLPTRDGERVIYQAYTKGRYLLYQVDPAQGTPAGTEEAPAEVLERQPFVPPVTVTVDPTKVVEARKTKFFLDNASAMIGVNTGQTFQSDVYLSFSDQYGDRRFDVLLSSISGYSSFQLWYNNMAKRTMWGATVFDDREFYVTYDTLTGFENRQEQLYRQTGVAAYAQYPLSLYHRVEGNVGYIDRSYAYPVSQNLDGSINYESFKDKMPFLQGAFIGDTTFWRDYGPHAGRRYSFTVLQGFDAINGGTLTRDYILDARQYVPISYRNEFALRLYAAWADGNSPSIFYFGGLDTVRGYPYNSLYGNRAGYLNAEWRFPLIDHLVLPWLHLQGLRGRMFVDVGAAWLDLPGFPPDYYDFWKDGHLQDGVADYGVGFSVDLFGLPLHWDFAKRWNFSQTLSGYQTSFWIGFRY
jgi:Tol biopolymer transport system component